MDREDTVLKMLEKPNKKERLDALENEIVALNSTIEMMMKRLDALEKAQ